MPPARETPFHNGLNNAFAQSQALQAERDRQWIAGIETVRARVAGSHRIPYQWGQVPARRVEDLMKQLWDDPVLREAALLRGTAYVMEHYFDLVGDRTPWRLDDHVMRLSIYADRTKSREPSLAIWKDADARGANLVQVDWALCSFYNLRNPYHDKLRRLPTDHARFAAALKLLLEKCKAYLDAKSDFFRASSNAGSLRVAVVREVRDQALGLYDFYQNNLKRGRDPALMVFPSDPNVAAFTPKGSRGPD